MQDIVAIHRGLPESLRTAARPFAPQCQGTRPQHIVGLCGSVEERPHAIATDRADKAGQLANDKQAIIMHPSSCGAPFRRNHVLNRFWVRIDNGHSWYIHKHARRLCNIHVGCMCQAMVQSKGKGSRRWYTMHQSIGRCWHYAVASRAFVSWLAPCAGQCEIKGSSPCAVKCSKQQRSGTFLIYPWFIEGMANRQSLVRRFKPKRPYALKLESGSLGNGPVPSIACVNL